MIRTLLTFLFVACGQDTFGMIGVEEPGGTVDDCLQLSHARLDVTAATPGAALEVIDACDLRYQVVPRLDDPDAAFRLENPDAFEVSLNPVIVRVQLARTDGPASFEGQLLLELPDGTRLDSVQLSATLP